jgi:hypothetical protein
MARFAAFQVDAKVHPMWKERLHDLPAGEYRPFWSRTATGVKALVKPLH